jgi:hypothetical protein
LLLLKKPPKLGKHQCLHGAEGANAGRQDVFGLFASNFPSNFSLSTEVAALQVIDFISMPATSAATSQRLLIQNQQLLIKLSHIHTSNHVDLSRLRMHLESFSILFCILYLLNSTSLDESVEHLQNLRFVCTQLHTLE